MSYKKNVLVAVSTAVVVSGALYSGIEAKAAWVRANPSFCSPGDSSVVVGSSFRGSGAGDDSVVCPLLESDGLQRDDLTTFNVYVSDSDTAGEVSARVCRAFWTGGVTSCGFREATGDGATPGTVTWDINDLDMSAWNATGGTAYLLVTANTSGIGVPGYFGYYASR